LAALQTTGAAAFGGALSTSGAASLASLDVAGNSRLAALQTTGAAAFGGALSTSGAASLASLNVAGDSRLAALATTGAAAFGGALSTSGAASLASLEVAGDSRLAALATTGAAAFGGALSTSGAASLASLSVSGNTSLAAATGLTVIPTDNSTALATTAFVQTAVAGVTLSGNVNAPVTFLQGITVSGTLNARGPLAAASTILAGGATGVSGQVLTSTGAGPVAWTTPVTLVGQTSATYGNTALGVGAGVVNPGINSTFNTAIGYNAQVPNPAAGHQIVLGTSTEAIYIQGGLYLNVGAVIADPLPEYLNRDPIAQFYTITAANAGNTGTIHLPAPAAAKGADVLFRFRAPSSGNVTFVSDASVIVPMSAATPTITYTPAAGTYVLRLTSDGASWYQTQ
jgi:hypothetical protein